PLVTGQTRISSSLASTDCPFQARDERRFDACPDGQIPAATIGERGAFYRILLGHQDRRGVGKLELRTQVVMVVGERVTDRIEPETTQQIEKALRIADACDGMNGAAAPGVRI